MRLRYCAYLCGNVQGHLPLQSSVQLFGIAFLIKKFSFCGVPFKRIWHGNETFPKSSSQNEIVPLLVAFHLPDSKCNGMEICFYSCRYQNQNFSLVQNSCCTRAVSVALVSQLCCTCGACVSLVLHSCCICVTLVVLGQLVSGTLILNQTRS